MAPTTNGIDGTVELAAALSGDDVLTQLADIPAAHLYKHLQAELSGIAPVQAQRCVATLVRRLGIWWSSAAYAAFPVIVPWSIRDRSCRYDAGPEAWGSARADGLLRDDNSIIKKLPLSLT